MPKREITWKLLRIFPDGMREFEASNGRRQRVYYRQCAECFVELPEREFMAPVGANQFYAFCPDCLEDKLPRHVRTAEEDAEQEAYNSRREAERKIAQIQLARDLSARRGARLRAATPRWADRDAIARIYSQARQQSVASGTKHHVDHIWPIYNELCCGLHVPWNLRIISASENCAKGYRLPTEMV